MEVILLKDVRRLGQAGDMKHVADGYARNYLIPRQLAVQATQAARKRIEEKAAAEARRTVQQKVSAERTAEELQHVELLFKAKVGESGRLYGSVTSADIAERLAEKIGAEVDKRKVSLDEPIREIGSSLVQVKLHTDVQIQVTVIVEPDNL